MTLMGMWLEVGPCSGDGPRLLMDHRIVQEIPALAEALEAAQQASTKPHSGWWEYSQRISKEEFERIRDTIAFPKSIEDARSIVSSADIDYRDACYTLRLFAEKSQ
jgi:hypothetical protein